MPGKYITTRYCITNNKLPKSFDNKTCIVIADFHNALFEKKNEELIKHIDEISPDFIIIAGDLFNGEGESINSYLFLDKITKKYHVIFGEGNHELALKENNSEYFNKIRDMNICYLENTFTEYQKIRVYGLSIDKFFYNRFKRPHMTIDIITKKLGKPDKNCYNILVAHTPAYMKLYSKWGADLVISGHYHGGFVRLPFIGGVMSPQCVPFPRFCGGYYECNSTSCIVSKGMGSHTIPLRIFNPPELVIIDFRCRTGESIE